MKKIITLLMLLFTFTIVCAEKSKINRLSNLSKDIRVKFYPRINTRDIDTEDKGVSPARGFVVIQDNVRAMTFRSDFYDYFFSESDSAKEYLDFIFKYFEFDFFKEYIKEIDVAYSKMKKTAPKKEIIHVQKVFTNTSNELGNFRFSTDDIIYTKRDIPKETGVKETDKSFDYYEKLIEPLAFYQTWKDFFINGKKDMVVPALKEMHIREWLTYQVEYGLPQKDVPAYKKKLESFLAKWGI